MKKKILIASTMGWGDIYEKPLAHGFRKNNCIVDYFKIYKKPIYKEKTSELYKSFKFILYTRLKISFFLKKIIIC